MRLSEKINEGSTSAFLNILKESVDVYQFVVYRDDITFEPICNIIGCTPDDVIEIDGFMFNDFAPEDYIVDMKDGTSNLVNTKTKSYKHFQSRKDAANALFDADTNYNF